MWWAHVQPTCGRRFCAEITHLQIGRRKKWRRFDRQDSQHEASGGQTMWTLTSPAVGPLGQATAFPQRGGIVINIRRRLPQ